MLWASAISYEVLPFITMSPSACRLEESEVFFTTLSLVYNVAPSSNGTLFWENLEGFCSF